MTGRREFVGAIKMPKMSKPISQMTDEELALVVGPAADALWAVVQEIQRQDDRPPA